RTVPTDRHAAARGGPARVIATLTSPAVGPAPAAAAERRPRGQASLGAEAVFRDDPFDVVHVFRLATLPFARPWLDRPGRSPKRHLDLDDVESTTRTRLAALYRANGLEPLARSEEGEARRSRT